MDQYLYSRSRDGAHGFGSYFPTVGDVKEEDEAGEGLPSRRRHDSTTYDRPALSAEDEVRLSSVLDELHNVLGDQFSDVELTRTVIACNFDLEKSLNTLLNKQHAANA